VNEQTEIGLLLAVPGILATLVLAPWIIHLFYTQEFMPAVDLLQWLILGCFVRVFQWPMGFLQLALGRGGIWFATQTFFSLIHVMLIWLLIPLMGLEGVAIAFCVLYAISIIVIKWVGQHLTGFAWDKSLLTLIGKLTMTVGFVFVVERFYSKPWTQPIVVFIFMAVSFFSLRALISRVGVRHRLSKKLLSIPYLGRLLIE